MSETEGRCPECRSANLEVLSTREVQRPARTGEPPDVERRVIARKVEVRCRRCGCSEFIIRRIDRY